MFSVWEAISVRKLFFIYGCYNMKRLNSIFLFLNLMTAYLFANGGRSDYSNVSRNDATDSVKEYEIIGLLNYPALDSFILKQNTSYTRLNDEFIASLTTFIPTFEPNMVSVEKRSHNQNNLTFSKIYLSGADQFQRMELKKFSNKKYLMEYGLTSEHIFDFFGNTEYGKEFLSGLKVWGGIGFGMMGVLMVMPKSVTRWQDDYIQKARLNLNRAFSEPPIWDKDKWQINYVGHPIAGSLYYNTIRAKGGSPFQSFLFSTFVSTGWEYLYEGVAERPSIQDLIVTPVVGSLLGELSHQATIQMKKNGSNFLEKIAITIINPMHAIMEGY